MKIIFCDNEGAGLVTEKVIPEGTTAERFLQNLRPGRLFSDFIVRRNQIKAEPHTQLQDGDRVSLSPAKMTGAS